MEFADDGDLYQKIVDHKKRKELFEESEIWSVLIQTVIGLKTLHTLNILHRDLKVILPPSRAQTSSSPKPARPSWAI
jgi:serine/threonine protein kinase